jgi:hypothetical protein
MPDEAQRATQASSRPPGPVRVAVIAALALVAISLVWIASEQHYRSCVASAQARYPAIPVSAFNRKDIGPVKVSFVNERTKAVESCHHF